MNEKREGTACVDGLKLGVVTDEQHLRHDAGCQCGDAVQGQRACQGCVVDDDELVRGKRGPGALVSIPPFAVFSGGTRSSSARGPWPRPPRAPGKPPSPSRVLLPRSPEGSSSRSSRPRPRRTDEDINNPAGERDPGQRHRLVLPQHPPLPVGPGGSRLHSSQ